MTRKRFVISIIVAGFVGSALGSFFVNYLRSSAGTGVPFGRGSAPQAARPRLLDLGATKCIPCKMMAPILEELKQEYAGRMDVEFIDVWQNRDAAGQYGIESIPTQIFFDATGKELYRHQGFFAKEDILKKWQELGVDLTH